MSSINCGCTVSGSCVVSVGWWCVCVVVTPHTDTSKHRVHTTQEHDAVKPQCMQDSDDDGVRKHVEKRISQRKVQKCWRQLYTAFRTPHGTYKDMKVPRNFECLHFFHNNHHCKLVQLFPLEVKQKFQLKQCNVWLEGPSYSSNVSSWGKISNHFRGKLWLLRLKTWYNTEKS